MSETTFCKLKYRSDRSLGSSQKQKQLLHLLISQLDHDANSALSASKHITSCPSSVPLFNRMKLYRRLSISSFYEKKKTEDEDELSSLLQIDLFEI